MKKIYFSFILLYCFIVFSGLNLFWSYYPYDGFRILQILIVVISSIYLIFNKKNIFTDNYYCIFISLIILFIYSCLQAVYPLRALQEAVHFLGLLVVFIAVLTVLSNNNNQKIILAFSLFPLLTLIFLPIAITERAFLNNPYAIWTQSFINIRMLDDALLPCLFLLWYFSMKYFHNKKVIALIFLVSALFFLNFLMNGSRAIFLSLIIAFISFYLMNKKEFYLYFKIPFLSFLTACLFYWIYQLLSFDGESVSVLRYSSSGRLDIWYQAILAWSNQPFGGIGGNHLFLYIKNGVLHPHNLLILLLTEFGLIIFTLILYLLLLCVKKIIKHRNDIPTPLLIGLIGIGINALLSGSMVYPASQTLNIFYIAFTLSFIPLTFQKTNILAKIFVAIVLCATLFLQFQNITCINCMSVGDRQAPRFWNYGMSRNLVEYNEEKIGKKIDISEY